MLRRFSTLPALTLVAALGIVRLIGWSAVFFTMSHASDATGSNKRGFAALSLLDGDVECEAEWEAE